MTSFCTKRCSDPIPIYFFIIWIRQNFKYQVLIWTKLAIPTVDTWNSNYAYTLVEKKQILLCSQEERMRSTKFELIS